MQTPQVGEWSMVWFYTFHLIQLAIALLLLISVIATQFAEATIAAPDPKPVTATPTNVMRQGNQLSLNGQILPIPWSQWQVSNTTRTGISDWGLVQAIGAELLNTNDATKQPIQWFSQPTVQPIVLATRLSQTWRYLDITDLARQAGWQIQINGNVLQLAAPTAKVLAVRQAKQSWGDRLVIDLDRPTPWQVEERGQELTVKVNAQTARNVAIQPGNQTAFKLESASNQTQIRLTSAVRPRVWSLTKPDRLIVDLRPDAVADQNILWATGLRWRRQTLTLGSDRFPVTWLELDARLVATALKPILPNPTEMVGIATLAQTAQQAQVAAVINGGFFNRNNQHPLGAVRLDGRWRSGAILNRGAIGWNAAGEMLFDRLTLQETLILPNAERLPLTHLNTGYIQPGIARYSADWGKTYTPLTDSEILVSVQNDRVLNQQTIAKANSAAIPIPPNGYLLVLRASSTLATKLAIGTAIRLETTTSPSAFDAYPQVIAAGPLLLQNRQIVLDPPAEKFSPAFAIERASRSAIAQTATGTILLVTVHAQTGGNGANLSQLAQLLQQLGAVNALNLDGGSSTTLILGGQRGDRPTANSARVHNGIGIFLPQVP
jgi:hypothetical protein